MKKLLPYIIPMIRSIIFIVGGLLFSQLTNTSLPVASTWWAPLCILYNIITIIILKCLTMNDHIRFMDIVKRNKGAISIGSIVGLTGMMLLIGGVGMIGFSFLFYGGLPEFLVKPISIELAIIVLVFFPISIVFAEMPLYYGYALEKIKNQNDNVIFANLYIIFFYGLQHSFIPLLFDFKYMIYRFVSFLPLMIFLSFYYAKKKNLTHMMIGHGVMDLGTAIQIFIMSILVY